MKMRISVFLLVFAVILNFPISKASADLFSIKENFKKMEEKIEVRKKIKEIERENPDAFKMMMQNYEKFKSLSDEERETVKANWVRLKAMTEFQRQSIEKNQIDFNNLSQEKKNQLIKNYKIFKRLPQNIRNRLRGDDKFRAKFNKSAWEKGKSQQFKQRKIKMEKIRKQMQLRQRRSEASSIV